ncbi:MAG: aspartate/glutamate racemase family protein, partial [Clostridiales bacterium]|nr:aspartate/glutamate racemase family protein [Clostridiales bacterium]
MKKRLFLIHTTNKYMELIFNPFAKPFLQENPDVDVFNICDDSLMPDTLKTGKMSNDVAYRILNYVYSAERAGANMVMITCTTMNESAKYARRFAGIPVINIDEPMAKMAVEAGRKIGVLATLPTSPHAVVRLLNEEAEIRGKKIETKIKVVDGAFDILISGDRQRHDNMVVNALDELAKEVDAIAFAQITMSLLEHGDYGKPIFKIGKSGFDEAKRLL